MYVAFPSIKGKYDEAVHVLKNSLPSEWRSRYIIVYQGEDRDECVEYSDGHFEVYLKRNIYEYGLWVGVQMLIDKRKLPKDTWFLFIHDTCKFLSDNCVTLVENYIRKLQDTSIDMIWMCRTGQCNICLVRRSGISYGSIIYKDDMTLDKHEAIRWEHTFANDKSPKSFKVPQLFLDIPNHVMPKRKVYSSIMREVLYYPSLDMEKYFVYFGAAGKHPELP